MRESHYIISGGEHGAPGWAHAIAEAERRGLDPSREFRACSTPGIKEFWQVPTPTPNDMLRAAAVLEKVG